jgi:hypothetical protein
VTDYQDDAHPTVEGAGPHAGQPSKEGPETSDYALAPGSEDLAANPALVVLIGDGAAGQDIMQRYPAEWVVSLDDPEIPGQYASELGASTADTPLTVRLRGRLPVVLAPDSTTLGELGEFNRADILAVAATYGVPAHAVLIPEDGDTEQEFPGLPTSAELAAEGWSSY